MNTIDIVKNFAVIKSVSIKSFHCIYSFFQSTYESALLAVGSTIEMMEQILKKNVCTINIWAHNKTCLRGSDKPRLKPVSSATETTVKPVLSDHSKRRLKLVFMTNYICILLNAGKKYCRMLHLEHSAILLTCITLPFCH